MPKFSRFTLIRRRPFVLSLSCVLAGAMLATFVLGRVEASSVAAGGDVPSAALFMSPFFQSQGARSLSLAGGARVDVPSSASLNITGPVTVEAWVKTTTTGDQAIVERYAPYPGAGVVNGGYVLRLMGGRVTFATLKNSNEFDYVQGSTAVTAGVWHHVAGVFDGSQLRVYLDGAADGSKASTFAPGAGTAPVRIGAKGDDLTLPFNGLVDEARVSAAALYTVNFTPAANLTAINGVRGLWKFDGQGASDASGNGNHGTLLGAASFSAETCDNYQTTPDNSLSLGGGSRVDVPSSASLNITGPVTVEAWVKTTTTGDQAIVERYAPYPGAGVVNGGYVLRLMGGRVTFATLRNSNELDYQQGATPVSVGVWHHVAGVFDGSQLRVYLDGALDGSKATTMAPGSGTAPVRIGAKGDDLTLPFNGLIDEARVSAAALYGVNFTPATCLSAVADTRGLWKLDGQAASDSSGSNNHGTLHGGTSFSADTPHNPSVYGSAAYSLSLNGAGSYVSVPNGPSLNVSGPLTVEAWIKTNSSAQQGIVERYGWLNSDDGGYALRIEQGRLKFMTVRNANTYDSVAGSTAVSAGVWHHVAGVFDGSELRVYLDGKEDGVKASSVAPAPGTQSLKIGARGNDGAFSFNGLIDEVRVSAGVEYAGNFTARSIREVGGTFENPSDGQRGVWLFDDGTANDSSGNNNNGTFVGGALLSTETFGAANINYQNLTEGTSTDPKVTIGFDGLDGQKVSTQYKEATFCAINSGFNVACTEQPVGSYYTYATTLSPVYESLGPRLTRGTQYDLDNHLTSMSGRFRNFRVEFPKPASNIKFEGIGVLLYSTRDGDREGCTSVAQINVYRNDVPANEQPKRYHLCGRPAGSPPDKAVLYDLNKVDAKNVTAIEFHTIVDVNGLDFDAFTFTVPAPSEIQGVTYEEVTAGQLTPNPNVVVDGGTGCGGQCGVRMYPDKTVADIQNPSAAPDRTKVRVKAVTTYPPNTNIYFKSFDVDDPSTNDTASGLDFTGSNGDDNRGNKGTPLSAGVLSLVGASGTTNTATAKTDDKGVAVVEFAVTKHPGDNFRVAASTDQSYLNALTVSGTGLKDSSGAALPTRAAKNTEMLTVWRRLHVEVDSMGIVTGNHLSGTVLSTSVYAQTRHCGPNGSQICMYESTRICVDKSLADDPLLTHFSTHNQRFQGGQIIINSVRYDVASTGSDKCNYVDLGKVVPLTVEPGTPFTLYDDDDWNLSDRDAGGALRLDGDESFEDIEPITTPLTRATFSLMQESDNPASNVFAQAYIMPVIDGGGNPLNNQSNLNFKLNVNFSDGIENYLVTSPFIGSRGNEADDFWVAYLLLAYQGDFSEDGDPDYESGVGAKTSHPNGNSVDTTDSVTGANVPQGGPGSIIFMELCKDHDLYYSKQNTLNRSDWTTTTAPHELGHQMALSGDDIANYGIMSYGAQAGSRFAPAHINILRWRVKSPGR